MAKGSAPRNRCTYREGNRRCAFQGHGTPCLCDPHRMVLAEAARPRSPLEVLTQATADYLQGKPINREATIGAVQQFAAQWAGGLGADYRPDMFDGASESTVHRRAQAGNGATPDWRTIFGGGAAPGAAPRQPPPPDPRVQEVARVAAARRILGFTQAEKLTADVIKDRHRRLAKKNHPDRGGSTEKMMGINNARDVLLAGL